MKTKSISQYNSLERIETLVKSSQKDKLVTPNQKREKQLVIGQPRSVSLDNGKKNNIVSKQSQSKGVIVKEPDSLPPVQLAQIDKYSTETYSPQGNIFFKNNFEEMAKRQHTNQQPQMIFINQKQILDKYSIESLNILNEFSLWSKNKQIVQQEFDNRMEFQEQLREDYQILNLVQKNSSNSPQGSSSNILKQPEQLKQQQKLTKQQTLLQYDNVAETLLLKHKLQAGEKSKSPNPSPVQTKKPLFTDIYFEEVSVSFRSIESVLDLMQKYISMILVDSDRFYVMTNFPFLKSVFKGLSLQDEATEIQNPLQSNRNASNSQYDIQTQRKRPNLSYLQASNEYEQHKQRKREYSPYTNKYQTPLFKENSIDRALYSQNSEMKYTSDIKNINCKNLLMEKQKTEEVKPQWSRHMMQRISRLPQLNQLPISQQQNYTKMLPLLESSRYREQSNQETEISQENDRQSEKSSLLNQFESSRQTPELQKNTGFVKKNDFIKSDFFLNCLINPIKKSNQILVPRIQKIQVQTQVREKLDIGFFTYYYLKSFEKNRVCQILSIYVCKLYRQMEGISTKIWNQIVEYLFCLFDEIERVEIRVKIEENNQYLRKLQSIGFKFDSVLQEQDSKYYILFKPQRNAEQQTNSPHGISKTK